MKMAPANLAIGIFLFSQTTVGMLGNSSILFYYVILIVNRKHLKPKDLTIEHLTFANCLSLITKGIPWTMAHFQFKDFLGNTGCKLIVYIYRIARGVSLYAMCILSSFQTITISPKTSRWMKHKHRVTKYIGPSCSLSWLVHLLLNISTPTSVSGLSYKKNVTNWVSYGYCSWIASSNVTSLVYMFFVCFTDGLCLILITCSSIYMVIILYRHKRQVKHVHSAQHFRNVSPEDRASQTILTLVCTFVITYSVSSLRLVFGTSSKGPIVWGEIIFLFLEICFPIVCPFVLLTNIKPISRPFLVHCGKR
ncbi:vomeronasal type-1 receptor 4-like [Mesocricetus auratus]|uniref:Vomeronasal type-1 receptor n=1 Tax=Mesocricetus auratus TaxID=10036 RepID=A0A1U7QX73_MESAU|nr:vomeronasal type-1 receptor 4-like [Mesocricetus auratus]